MIHDDKESFLKGWWAPPTTTITTAIQMSFKCDSDLETFLWDFFQRNWHLKKMNQTIHGQKRTT